ncbi:hypothetical protein BKA62DRAFT_707875 [Auriculariales sp. MPI-PUGE-AT-0066]|nr:hypothetical protein BKA62DRAFT_707875 [Auriculariales sp. MPI-PUGE-AT-0066]
MAINHYFGFREAVSESQSRPVLALQFRSHASISPNAVTAASSDQRSRSAARNQASSSSIVNQVMYSKRSRRPVYLTVTRGAETELWRVDAAHVNSARDPQQLLHLVATVVWAAPEGCSANSYPAVRRHDVLTRVDELLTGGSSLFGKGSGKAKQYLSSTGLLLKWKPETYGLGQRRWTVVCSEPPSPNLRTRTARGRPSSSSSETSSMQINAAQPGGPLAELYPPEPGSLKPFFNIFSAAQQLASTLGSTQSNNGSSPTAELAQLEQVVQDELVLTAILMVAQRDDWRTIQSPNLDDIVRAELGSAYSGVGTASLASLTSTLPPYGSSTSLPSYATADAP